MPTIFTHALVAGSLGTFVARRPHAGAIVVTGVVCSILPDADVIAFAYGFPYDHMLGHRGLSHSIVFALGLAVMAALPLWTRLRAPDRAPFVLFLFLATMSHGVLDAMTDGGLGVAFFAPFSGERYFFPWRPIVVSPISARALLSEWGLRVFTSEIVYLWLPAIGLALVGRWWARRTVPDTSR